MLGDDPIRPWGLLTARDYQSLKVAHSTSVVFGRTSVDNVLAHSTRNIEHGFELTESYSSDQAKHGCSQHEPSEDDDLLGIDERGRCQVVGDVLRTTWMNHFVVHSDYYRIQVNWV